MKRIYIVNPKSGNGKPLSIIGQIQHICEIKKYGYKIVFTEHPHHATEIAKYYGNPNNVIFSVGGDGTLNEIINGLEKNSLISVVPCGSGNDFYKVIDNKTNYIDLGQVNDRKFINIASLGIDANVAYISNVLKDKKVSNAYLKAIIQAIKEYENLDTNLGLKTLIAICNGNYYGGGFHIATNETKINDGLLDVCMVKNLNRVQVIYMFLQLILKTHIYSKTFKSMQVENIEIQSRYNIKCNIDGEILEGNNFIFQVLPSYLKYYQEEDQDLQKVITK